MLLRSEHGLRSVENAKFFEDLIDVNLNGLLADVQVICDDLVGMALCNQIKHFELALCEPKLFGFGDFSRGKSAGLLQHQRLEFANDEFSGAVF